MRGRPTPLPVVLCLLGLACAGSPAVDPARAAKPAAAATRPVPAPEKPSLAARLAQLDARLEQTRKDLKIPGLALVIVKDNRVVYLEGKGHRNLAEKLPVSDKTLFAVGSTTKAFTALLALMAQEQGVLSLDDSPKKCLPYFSLADKEADAQITVRDLLTHTSGLMRTDLGWYTGRLSKEEVIRLAGRAKPVAPLGKEWHYQNVMYLAAGECVAAALGASFDELVKTRIFQRLGMNDSNVSAAETLTLPSRAVGYAEMGPNQELRPVPMRPLDNIAPAGAINASARDMGQWLRLLLGQGEINGIRLASKQSFAQFVKPYIDVAPRTQYGLGWMISEWSGDRMISHTGGIDGFVTLVAFLPDKKVGFGLFTNIQNDKIHGYVTNEVFSLFREEKGSPAPGGTAAMIAEAGAYGVVGGISIEVEWVGDHLVLKAPSQPPYPLELIAGRRYRVGPPAPAGFHATFRNKKDGTGRVLFLEQPFGNLTFSLLTPEYVAAVKKERPSDELMALLGVYRASDKQLEVEVGLSEGRVAALLPGQPPTPLLPHAEDEYLLEGLPEAFRLKVARDARGQVTAVSLTQPAATLELVRVAGSGRPEIAVEELERRVSRAHRQSRLARLKTLVVRSKVDFVHQGLGGARVLYQEAPNKYAQELALTAFDRVIGRIRTVYDGEKGAEEADFVPSQELRPAQLDLRRVAAPIAAYGDWKHRFDSVQVVRSSRLDGEDAVVVQLERQSGVKLTDYYSMKSFLLRKRDIEVPVLPDAPPLRTTDVFLDYRHVGGIPFPHRVESETPWGNVVVTVERVEPDGKIPGDAFAIPGSAAAEAE